MKVRLTKEIVSPIFVRHKDCMFCGKKLNEKELQGGWVHWGYRATEKYPNKLPNPFSSPMMWPDKEGLGGKVEALALCHDECWGINTWEQKVTLARKVFEEAGLM